MAIQFGSAKPRLKGWVVHDLIFQEWSDVDGWCGQRRPPVQVDVRQVDPGRILGPKQRHYYAMANGYLPKLSSQNFSAKFATFLAIGSHWLLPAYFQSTAFQSLPVLLKASCITKLLYVIVFELDKLFTHTLSWVNTYVPKGANC